MHHVNLTNLVSDNYNWQTDEWVNYYSTYMFMDSLEFGGYKYYQLFEAKEPDFTFQPVAFYREENNKVYYTYNENFEEKLLYDFDLEVGDTLLSGDQMLIIGTIDSIQLNDGSSKKRLTTSLHQLEIIEDIGSLRSPFDPHQFFIGDASFNLSCCLLKDEVIYTNPGIEDFYCNTSALFDPEKDKSSVAISDNTLVASGSLLFPLEINYYNFEGKLLSTQLTHYNHTQLPASLPLGMNIVRIQDSAGNQFSHVFLHGQ